MHVVLGDVRQLEVHDVGEPVDVEAACGDVGGDEHAHGSALEVRERTQARVLALVPVNRRCREVCAIELADELVRAVLGPREDQDLGPAASMDQVGEQIRLALALDVVDHLRDGLDGAVARRDVDALRALEQPLGQRSDRPGERRAEQQALTLRGQVGEHPPDVVDEAHVQHPVRLVQHEHLDPPEIDRPATDVVEKSARRRDHDVAARAERGELRSHPDAAEDGGAADRNVRPVGRDALADLERELARRHEDKGAHGPGPRCGRCRGQQALQQREREARGLAGAGLGGGEDVFSAKNRRDRLALDGGGCVVALLGDGRAAVWPRGQGNRMSANSLLDAVGQPTAAPTGRCQATVGTDLLGEVTNGGEMTRKEPTIVQCFARDCTKFDAERRAWGSS